MEGKTGDIVLPEDTGIHHKIYTFEYLTNTLYHGSQPIMSPIVKSLAKNGEKVAHLPLRKRCANDKWWTKKMENYNLKGKMRYSTFNNSTFGRLTSKIVWKLFH